MKGQFIKLLLKVLPYNIKLKIAQKLVDNRLIVTRLHPRH